MRYNSKIQNDADAFAKEHNYFCAVYLGPTDEGLVFIPRDDDNAPKCTGLAVFIIYKDGKFYLDRGLNFCKYTDQLHYVRSPRKGKTIFERYVQMDKEDAALSESDRAMIREIVQMSKGDDISLPVPRRELFEALEIAERMDMTIEFFSDDIIEVRPGVQWYNIRIIPGKLPQLV